MGQTIIGGVIGALVGLAAYVGLEIALAAEHSWFAIVVGLLTGLGVRQLNSSAAMHRASYLRGAIAGLIALAAIAGAPSVKAMVMKRGAEDSAEKPAVKTPEAPDESDDGGGADAVEVEEVPEPAPAPGRGLGDMKAPAVPGEPDVMQAVFMALGAFVAYEFARGSGGSPAPAASDQPPAEPAPEETAAKGAE